MSVETRDKTATVAQRRRIATHWLIGPRHNWTDEHAALFGTYFPAVAALSDDDSTVLRAQHLDMMLRRDRADVAATVAQIRAMGRWWGLEPEWMRLVCDVVNHVTGVDR